MAKAPVLPSERDVKRLVDELRHDARALEPVIAVLSAAGQSLNAHLIHVAHCRMIDSAYSLDMLRKLIPARGPFDG